MYKESETIELKSKVTSNLCKEIIAFANTNGGTIYIGYDDDSNLIGVENAKEELDKISNMISDTIDPNLIFNISILRTTFEPFFCNYIIYNIQKC